MNKISMQITLLLAKYGGISKNELSIYAYGIELILSGAISVSIVLIISYYLDQVINGFFFLVGFIPMRMYAGGYHANTHFTCKLFISAIYIVATMLSKIISISKIFYLLLFEILALVLFSPTASPNKKISEIECVKYRNSSFIIAGFNIIVYIYTQSIQYTNITIIFYFLGGILATTMLIIERIKRMLQT